MVSVRLPVSVSKQDGELIFKPSAGGLATGVASLKKSKDSIWIGWPGIVSDVLNAAEKRKITTELKKYGCVPVFLSAKQVEYFYEGFSNSTLWPLFHYFPTMSEHNPTFWKVYAEVNQLFTKTITKHMTDMTMVWIHDYQLMLAPAMLRKLYRNSTIGFFLHTPFPAFEIFRLIPKRAELLDGLLGANLVGFHNYDYVKHFLESVKNILGHDHTLGSIKVGRQVVRTDAFPIGIDYKRFAKGAKRRAVRKLLKSFNLFNTKTKVILSVDRADYSKGIVARLDAYEHFLKTYPEHRGKAVLVLIAVPSRENVGAYKELRDEIEKRVSRINGEFATVDWSPISYRYQSLPFDELCALYALADVMLVTPLRDGMNLVAKEYVATRHKSNGVLILSEMAGVAHELRDALLVNPYNSAEISEALDQGLTMSNVEQRTRMKQMQARVSGYTINQWAEDFISQLRLASTANLDSPKLLNDKRKKELLNAYKKADRRLIMLDYDGTLRDYVSSHDEQFARPTREVKKILKRLTSDPKNSVVIISGRPRNTLEGFFGDHELGLVAEHGGWVLDAGGWIKSSINAKKWKKSVKSTLEQFVVRTPGSALEEKDFSFVFHFRRVNPGLAHVRKEELMQKLRSTLKDDLVGVFEGEKIVEIKPKRMNKGIITRELIKKEDWGFILAIGDDYTDEDIFNALPETAYSIKVGIQPTDARYQLADVKNVIELIKILK